MKKLFVIIALTFSSMYVNGQTLSAEDRQTMRLAEQDGYVICNCKANEILIKPTLWKNLPYASKRNLGEMYAIKCAGERKSNLRYIKILDYYSGKEIAKYSESWGFKIH